MLGGPTLRMSSRRRTVLFVPLFILLCSVLGGLLGPEGVSAAAAVGPEDEIKGSLKSFTKLYDLVEENFADKVTPDKAIYKGAIPGMLRTLDPHSNFFDPRDFQILKEDQKGHYYGVGMTVSSRNGKTVVMSPFGGSPAYKAGIRPADVIVEVNDKKTDGLTTTEVADLLKGPRGTHVQIVVAREGLDRPITFDVIRDEISRASVMEAFWIRPGIAYTEIQQFSETTSKELEDGLRKLGEANIKGLILDLRGNPGGLLNEGVEVAGHFLKKGDVVVSQRGRGSAEKPYYARRGNGGRDYPIVVLVNRYSASAAEIVAGALQDHDRGWIFGENTFGKGLVQTVYPLSENTGLALTTYHYYTPSGRLIQRDYSHISFLDYYYHRTDNVKNDKDVKMTDAGRTVYGGGGITPDEKYATPKLNKFQTEVLRKDMFFRFTGHYFGSREKATLSKGWSPDDTTLNELHDFMLHNGAEFTEAEFTENHEWLRTTLKHEMYITAFSKEEADRAAVEDDPEVIKAIGSMDKAHGLLADAKKMLVQRMNNQRFGNR
jgi:carboxyl-terminal processing protease